jgi:predicted phage terminase large subunit-like protein
MVEWHYEIHEFIGGKAVVFYYMEANFMQDTLLEEFSKLGKEKGMQLPIKGDTRKKPDKAQRIEGLEPYFSRSQFFFSEDEKSNPGMKQLIEQFEAFQRGSKIHDDGPDACEGAVHLLNNKTREDTPYNFGTRSSRTNSKRY